MKVEAILQQHSLRAATAREEMAHPLEMAVTYNDENIVRLFIDSADVNMRSALLGRTLLHIAARNSSVPIAGMLLARGARVDDASHDRLTALHIAVANHSKPMVELLLKAGASPNPACKFNGKTPLYLAVEHNCLTIAELLLQRGASISDASILNTTVLHVALRIGAFKMARLLLEYSVGEQLDVIDNLEGKAPLHIAVEREQHDIVEMLLRKGANVDLRYVNMEDPIASPLSIAVSQRDDRMVELLLNNGANSTAEECLHQAVRQRSRGIVALILKKGGVKVDCRDKDGLTPLHVALINGYTDIVQLCLKHEASVADNVPTDDMPVLYHAIKCGDPEMVEMLINSGAPVNGFVRKNVSLLDVAIKSRSVNVTKLLLRCGSVINIATGGNEQIFVLKYVAMLLAEGEQVCHENRRLIDEWPAWSRYYAKCCKELERMKQEFVAGSISFYKLLTQDENSLAGYARNKEFLMAFPRSGYRSRFGIYGETLALNYTKGRVRSNLLEKATADFALLSKFGLPSVCARNVLQRLTNDDLRSFIKGVCGCNPKLTHICLPPLMVSF